MSQQIQKECFICHQQVLISKPTPDSKWIKSNLDGSIHVDPQRPRGMLPPQQISLPTSRYTPDTQENNTSSSPRNEAWAVAHEENITASKNLNATLQSIDRTLTLLTEVIKAYMENPKL